MTGACPVVRWTRALRPAQYLYYSTHFKIQKPCCIDNVYAKIKGMNQDGTPVSPQPPIFSGAAPSAQSNSGVPGYFNEAMGDIVIDDPNAKKKKSKLPFIIGGAVLLVVAIAAVVLIPFLGGSSSKVASNDDIKKNITEAKVEKVRILERRLNRYSNGESTFKNFVHPSTSKDIADGFATLKEIYAYLKDINEISYGKNKKFNLADTKSKIKKSIDTYDAVIKRYNSFYSFVNNGETDDLYDSFSDSVKKVASSYRGYKEKKAEEFDDATLAKYNDLLNDRRISIEVLLGDSGITDINSYAVTDTISSLMFLSTEVES